MTGLKSLQAKSFIRKQVLNICKAVQNGKSLRVNGPTRRKHNRLCVAVILPNERCSVVVKSSDEIETSKRQHAIAAAHSDLFMLSV